MHQFGKKAWMVQALTCVAIWSALTVALPVRAQAHRPVVLVVNVGKTDAARERERRFVADLQLNIEGFTVRQTDPSGPDFSNLSINRQIELLKPLMRREYAVAAMWLTESAGDTLMLQVVVLDTGRALVRLFEEDLGGGSEGSLALTAGELLGTAYMFEPEKAAPSPAIEKLVAETRKQAQVPLPASRLAAWKLVLIGHGAAGVLRGSGPDAHAGGSIWAERAFADRWLLGIGMGATAGPLGDRDGYSLSGYEIAAELTATLSFPFRRVRFGPYLQIRAGSGSILVSSPDVEREDYAFLCLFGQLGLDLRIVISEKVSLKLAAAVEASPVQTEIRRASNDEIIQENSLLRVWGGLGLVLF